MMRRNAQADLWHPSTDNALGSDEYGTFSNDPQGAETFSIRYDYLAWTKILFRSGDETEYIVMDRSVLETLVSDAATGTDCSYCDVPMVTSSCEGTARTQLMRNV